MNKKRIAEILGIIGILSVGRLLMTSPPNFNPIGAMALFGGAVFLSKKMSFIIPLAALLVGDLVYASIFPEYMDYLLMKNGYSVVFVYAAFAIMVVMGQRFLSQGRNTSKVIGTAIGAGVVFFLVTNFGAWIGSPFYPQTAEGLLGCYEAGLLFYKNEWTQNFALNGLVSTVLFSLLAFYAYDLSAKVFHKTAEA